MTGRRDRAQGAHLEHDRVPADGGDDALRERSGAVADIGPLAGPAASGLSLERLSAYPEMTASAGEAISRRAA